MSIGSSRPELTRVKLWSVVLIAYHYIVLWNDGAELGGGTRFFSTHKPTAHTACIACPGNLAGLKPPLPMSVSKYFHSCLLNRKIFVSVVFSDYWGTLQGVTNHWTEVDWTGPDWTHKNVRNKLINHRKQNLCTRKIEPCWNIEFLRGANGVS